MMFVNLFGAESATAGGGRVMVHCEAGRSRSATVCIQCNVQLVTTIHLL
jgi:protein-tyrosine phosphatase